MVSDKYPDGTHVDHNWRGGMGFLSVSNTVVCCDEPSVDWADCSDRGDPYAEVMMLEDNNTEKIPEPEEKKIERFAYIVSCG